MSTEDLERLELKIAYLERANQELGGVVFRQQQEIQALNDRITALAARLDGLRGEDMRVVNEEPRRHF